MRRVLSWLLVVLGAVVFLPALAAAVWVGTDDTAQTGPHTLTTPGVAVLTRAEILHYVGPVLHLTVERADGGPVFLGIAHEVDAESYVGQHSRSVVSRLGLPWDIDVEEPEGNVEALPPPAEQLWWLTSVEGPGAQELVWPLPHGRYSIVGLNADGAADVDVLVTMGLEIDGTFYTLLAIAALGLLLLLVGAWLLLRRRRRTVTPITADAQSWAPPPDPSEPRAEADR